LLGLVGTTRIHADLATLGMEHTYISEPRLTTSPHDMLRLLEPIARGQAVSPSASAEMVHLLLRQQINDRLPIELPAGTPVAHKTGNWGSAIHDAGIVYAPGTTYVIVVLTRDLANPSLGTRAIADLSKDVYDYFRQTPSGIAALPVPPGDFESYYEAPAIAPAPEEPAPAPRLPVPNPSGPTTPPADASPAPAEPRLPADDGQPPASDQGPAPSGAEEGGPGTGEAQPTDQTPQPEASPEQSGEPAPDQPTQTESDQPPTADPPAGEANSTAPAEETAPASERSPAEAPASTEPAAEPQPAESGQAGASAPSG